MSDFSLIAKFGMDATGVRTEIKKLQGDVNDFADKWAGIGFAAIGTAFVALSKGAIDLAGSLADASANIGINVVSLQALEAQHKRNGVSNELLTKGLEKVKQLSVDAAAGDEKAAAALAKLGISAQAFINLPLDQQYEAIAKGAAQAKNQSEAYGTISDIFGAKIGPKLMGSLKELADIGLPGVTKAARDAGQVMETETIVALDRAGDAIDDFKKKATIAVGNILIEFNAEGGLLLLGEKLLKTVHVFVGGILDAISEANDMLGAVFTGTFRGLANYFQDQLVGVVEKIATAINKVLPEKFEINVANLEQFKSSGKYVSDSITDAIALTKPSGIAQGIKEGWDPIIRDQQKIVDAFNNTKFGDDAKKLAEAGKAAGGSIAEGAEAAKERLKEAGIDMMGNISKSLNDFFGDLDAKSTSMKEGAAAMQVKVANSLTDFFSSLDAKSITMKEGAENAKRSAKEAGDMLADGGTRAGKNIKYYVDDAGNVLARGGTAAAQSIRSAAMAMVDALNHANDHNYLSDPQRVLQLGGKTYTPAKDQSYFDGQSDTVLREIIKRNQAAIQDLENQKLRGNVADAATGYLSQSQAQAWLQTEIIRAQAVLQQGSSLRGQDYGTALKNFNGPLDQFDAAYNKANSTNLQNISTGLTQLTNGLAKQGIISF